MERKLGKEEMRKELKRVRKWKVVRGKLRKEFRFGSFNNAIRFINKLRPIANRMNHHPELYNVYNKVVVELVTHDSGGLTALDFKFAKRVDKIRKS